MRQRHLVHALFNESAPEVTNIDFEASSKAWGVDLSSEEEKKAWVAKWEAAAGHGKGPAY